MLAVAAVAAVLWRRWRENVKAGKSSFERTLFSPPAPRVWIPVAAITAVFALPIVVELALHWPGNFVKYFTYTSSAKPVIVTPVQLVRYALWFWWPHERAWAVAVVLVAAAAGATWRLRSGPLRRFCGALLAADALSTVVFLGYAKDAADSLTNYYIGYFYWTAPLLAVLVIALAVTELVPGRVAAAAATCAAVAAAAAFAVAPLTRFNLAHVDPQTPSTTGIVTDPTLGPGTAFLAQRAERPAPGAPVRERRLAGHHRSACAGRADRRHRLRGRSCLGVHDDAAVHLHPGRAPRRRPVLRLPARSGAARYYRRLPASARDSDRRG